MIVIIIYASVQNFIDPFGYRIVVTVRKCDFQVLSSIFAFTFNIYFTSAPNFKMKKYIK